MLRLKRRRVERLLLLSRRLRAGIGVGRRADARSHKLLRELVLALLAAVADRRGRVRAPQPVGCRGGYA